jgi:hypothetical protein
MRNITKKALYIFDLAVISLIFWLIFLCKAEIFGKIIGNGSYPFHIIYDNPISVYVVIFVFMFIMDLAVFKGYRSIIKNDKPKD